MFTCTGLLNFLTNFLQVLETFLVKIIRVAPLPGNLEKPEFDNLSKKHEFKKIMKKKAEKTWNF